MSKRNPGGLISTTGLRKPSVIDQSKNSGVWTLEEQYQADARGTWGNQSGQTYQISNSLRFRANAVTTLTKTFSSTSTGNSKVFTYSFWVKKGLHNANMEIFSSAGPNHAGGADISTIVFNQDEIQFYHYPNGGSGYWLVKSYPMRDHSAWYHVVLSCDTNNPVDKLRARMWINGVEHVKSDNVYPTLNASTYYFSTRQQMWGQEDARTRYPFDGYLAELHAVDGQQLDASYFGYFDHNNIWQPKPYTGKYGINGYYFPFYPGSNINLADNYGNSSNYALQSESFDSGTWQKPAAPVAPTVTANSVVAPDSRTTADTLNFSTTNTHPVYQTISLTVPRDLGVVTGSVYLKQNTANLPVLFQVSLFNSGSVVIDGYGLLTFTSTQPSISNFNGSAGSHINARYENVGNGWYRLIVTCKNTTATTSNEIRISVGTNGQAGSVYAWGAMLNYGYQPGEYRATTTSAINNNWTPTQFDANDCMRDSPTDGNTLEDTGLGGQVSGNYCAWNPNNSANITLTKASLGITNYATGSNQCAIGTIGVTSGKWYFEYVVNASSVGSAHASAIGIVVNRSKAATGVNGFGDSNTLIIYGDPGRIYKAGSILGDYVSWVTGSVLQIALDVDAQKIWFGSNGTWASSGNPATGVNPTTTTNSLGTGLYEIITADGASAETNSTTVNFGQTAFAYAAPAGFKCLTTANLPQPTIPNGKKYFDTVLYRASTVNGIFRADGLEFRPDFTWIKNRDNVERHLLTDVVRGNVGVTDKFLVTSDTTVEGTNGVGGTTFSVTDTGYEFIETSITAGELYYSGRSYVGWNWKKGAAQGFDIVTYTEVSGLNTISHNLNSTPKIVLMRCRNVSENWVWWQSGITGANQGIYVNSTGGISTAGANWISVNSSNVQITSGQFGSPGNKVLYLFSEIPGFSKFGSYTGNGSTDGPFVFTGFKPRFILQKRSDSTGNWFMWDTARDSYNTVLRELYADSTSAEYTRTGSGDSFDILSNGFKIRFSSTYADRNANGGTYIYAAFAEHPFKNARAR